MAIIIVSLTLGFYHWTSTPSGYGNLTSDDGEDPYNLLTRGFLKGQLSLDCEPEPELAALKNPYDPVERGDLGRGDMSYFGGRYYLYFGTSPLLILLVPFKLATGIFLRESTAVLVFCVLGYLAALCLFGRIRRRHFPTAPSWAVAAGVIALGLATVVPTLLRRPAVWEVPIACGFACFMAAAYAVWRAAEQPRQHRWFWLAGLALGVGIAARPPYVLTTVLLFVPLCSHPTVTWRQREWWARFARLFIPLAATGLAMAFHNALRFGNPLDFGMAWQLTGHGNLNRPLSSFSFFPYNLKVYLFATPEWSRYFPFMRELNPPAPAPAGHLGFENPHGLISCIPWVLLGGATWVWAVRARATASPTTALPFVAGLTAASVGIFFSLCNFVGLTARYTVDFTPALVLLGSVGALVLATPTRARGVAAATIGFLLAWSVGFNVLDSLQHCDRFLAGHPDLYQRYAHLANTIATPLLDRLAPAEFGPVELRLTFPADRPPGKEEVLLATGIGTKSDFVFVRYGEADTVSFGFEHGTRSLLVEPRERHHDAILVSRKVAVAPGLPHTVILRLGSLYPPAAHPYFDTMAALTARARQRLLQITLDGERLVDRRVVFHDAAESRPSVGHSGGRPQIRPAFTGSILGQRRLATEDSAPTANPLGPLHLRLRLPPFLSPRSEPLLCTGEKERGDIVMINYESPTRITFGHDNWGAPVNPKSAPVAVVPGEILDLVISCPPLLAPSAPGRLSIRADGVMVHDVSEKFFPCTPATVVIGANEIEATTVHALFGGEVLLAERVRP